MVCMYMFASIFHKDFSYYVVETFFEIFNNLENIDILQNVFLIFKKNVVLVIVKNKNNIGKHKGNKMEYYNPEIVFWLTSFLNFSYI